MKDQNPMSGMPDLRAENRRRPVLIVEDEDVNSELLNAYWNIGRSLRNMSNPRLIALITGNRR